MVSFSTRFLFVFLLFIVSAFAGVDPAKLIRAVEENKLKVEEFKWLAEWGKANGVHVYAGGGTATGFAHYLKMDLDRLERKKNGLEQIYFDDRFFYNYFDIYRSTQDADIVLDATEEMAQKLEQELSQKFAYLEGSKTKWEVRLLRHPRGQEGTAARKDALLGDPNFLNQNSDSYSTALLELTEPENKRSPIRDLFDFENESPQFLKDLCESKITFYHNTLHSETLRASKGMNPEILSVIRALTKSFQYGGTIRDESEMIKIIKNFDIHSKFSDYTKKQITNNALKLFWHAEDVEHAWNTIERLGLRKKLVAFGVDWLDREPLRSFEVGKGTGKTAKELGIETVAHETNSYLAYESIIKSTRGKPNVFISRAGHKDETAVHGDGFYTRIGKEGARGTGLTVRFKVDPNAIEGVDFFRPDAVEEFLVFKNRNALKVIDESIEVSLLDYFKILDQFSDKDKAVLHKLKLKLKSKILKVTKEETDQIAKMVFNEVNAFGEIYTLPLVVKEWFSFPFSKNYPQYAEKIFQNRPSSYILDILTNEHWFNHEKIKALIDQGKYNNELYTLFGNSYFKDHSDLVLHFIQKNDDLLDKFVQYSYLYSDEAVTPEIVDAVIKKGGADRELVYIVLKKPKWYAYPEFIETIIKNNATSFQIASTISEHILSNPAWKAHSEKWIDYYFSLNSTSVDPNVVYALMESHFKHRSDWVELMIQRADPVTVARLRAYVLTQKHWVDHPTWPLCANMAYDKLFECIRDKYVLPKQNCSPLLKGGIK